jgi:membrane associated rhomboid family serine protease
MISDRHYMRESPYRAGRPVTVTLLITIAVAFALQQVNYVYLHFPAAEYLELSTDGLKHGFVWQLLSFQFLHAGFSHLFFNLMGLWFFGRVVEASLGRRHFLQLYFLCGVAGGILQAGLGLLFPMPFSIPVVGASAGVLGLIAAFALLEPEGEILLFFVLPIKAKFLLYFELAVALFFTVVPAEVGVAHAAHLGGILFAVGYIKWMTRSNTAVVLWRPFRRQPQRRELVSAPPMKRSPWKRPVKTIEEELPPGEFISKEVDPILDKISAHGIQSLTDREKQILEAARKKMAKR